LIVLILFQFSNGNFTRQNEIKTNEEFFQEEQISEKMLVPDDANEVDVELSELLDQAEMQELQEIADILGVTFQTDCKATKLKLYPEVAEENQVDFDDIITRIEANDSTLTSVNFNNVKWLNLDQWRRLFAALENVNTKVHMLSAANCQLNDFVTDWIARSLAKNSTLEKLTLDSNFISGGGLVKIMNAIAISKSLKELRCNNQVNYYSGIYKKI
jgi:hypothetical protein